MRKPSHYILVSVCLSGVLVGCTSGWTVSKMRERLNFGRDSKTSVSVAELQSRAAHLEKIKEYEIAEELYAEILKIDHDHEHAKERLTAIQRVKYGLAPEEIEERPLREQMPEQHLNPNRAIARTNLPDINPASETEQPSLVADDRSKPRPQSIPLDRLQQTAEVPGWVVGIRQNRSVKDEVVEKPAEQESSTKSAPPVKYVSIDDGLPAWAKADNSSTSVTVGHDREPHQKFEAVGLEGSEVSNVQQVDRRILTEFGTEKTIAELQKHLIASPTDQSAINELVKRLSTATRQELWQLSSLLEVLCRNEDSRVAVLASLSESLASHDAEVRGRALLVIAGLGEIASDLMPLVRLRLNDDSASVRQLADRAIVAIEG